MSGNIDNVLKILANNSEDVEIVIRQFGGIGAVIKAAPALLRIMKTISASRDPVAEAARVDRAMIYSQETKEAVERFQRKHGLHVDGLIGDFDVVNYSTFIEGAVMTEEELDAAADAVHEVARVHGIASWLNRDNLREVAAAVIKTIDAMREEDRK